MLALQVDFLAEAYRATAVTGGGPEWPPHPQRVFGALVQAWGDGGAAGDEEAALRWLEALPPPAIQAEAVNPARAVETPDVFVPVNDVSTIPDARSRQQRRFAWYRPDDPTVRFLWQADPGGHRAALARLATRLAALGHSSSLVHCQWQEGPEGGLDRPCWRPDPKGRVSLRVTGPGDLDRLQAAWLRHVRADTRLNWAAYQAPRETLVPPTASVFGGVADWLIYRTAEDHATDCLALAALTAALRGTVLAHCPPAASSVVTGHGADGGPTTDCHLAFIALPFVGRAYADGLVKGLAIILPRGITEADRRQVYRSLAAAEAKHGTVHLTLGKAGTQVLTRVHRPDMMTLRPEVWIKPSARWATATPMILDRHLKTDSVEEEADLIAAACVAIGLPEPKAIEIHKHGALAGAETCYPARRDARRPDWSFPAQVRHLAHRPRRHVVLTFPSPVTGPVILGAGRFYGFGLCRPLGLGEPQ